MITKDEWVQWYVLQSIGWLWTAQLHAQKGSSSMQQGAYENDGAVSLDLCCAPGRLACLPYSFMNPAPAAASCRLHRALLSLHPACCMHADDTHATMYCASTASCGG